MTVHPVSHTAPVPQAPPPKPQTTHNDAPKPHPVKTTGHGGKVDIVA